MTPRRIRAGEYAAMGDAVQKFRETLEEFLTHCATTGPWGPIGSWEVPKDGHEIDAERLKSEVSVLAGEAQEGMAVTGSVIGTRDEFGQPKVLNPAAAWLVITQPKALLGRDDVVQAARLAEGKLRALADKAQREERSAAGRLAALIGFPSRVRELAGFPKGSRAGTAAQWGVALLLGILGSLIASGIVALLVEFFSR